MKDYINNGFTIFKSYSDDLDHNVIYCQDHIFFDLVISENKKRKDYRDFNLYDFESLLDDEYSHLVIDRSPFVVSHKLAYEIETLKKIRRTLESKFKNISNIFTAYDSCFNELKFIQNEIKISEYNLISYTNQLINKYTDEITISIKRDVETILNLLLPCEIIKTLISDNQSTYKNIDTREQFTIITLGTNYNRQKLDLLKNIRNIWPRFYLFQELRNKHLYDIQDDNTLGRKRKVGLEDLVLKKWPSYLEKYNGNKSKSANMIIEDYMLKYIGKECSPKTVVNTVKRLQKEGRLSQQ